MTSASGCAQEPATANDGRAFVASLDALEDYVSRVRTTVDDSHVPHQVVMLIDPRRALDIARGGREQLSAAS